MFFSCKNKTKEASENNLTSQSERLVDSDKEEAKKNIKTTITLPSKDGLIITATVYRVNDKPISILLCHQAGFSRGEYIDSALELNKLGYSVMAIDQRSGNEANNVKNETAKRAKEKGLPTSYLNARQDIEASIAYVYKNNGGQKILLVGSSYSASLALLIGKDDEKVKAVASFSPGEYLKGINVNESIKGFNKPLFVTSSKSETPKLTTLVNKVESRYLQYYKPQEKGIYGSRALWNTTEGADGYWKAFKSFLKI